MNLSIGDAVEFRDLVILTVSWGAAASTLGWMVLSFKSLARRVSNGEQNMTKRVFKVEENMSNKIAHVENRILHTEISLARIEAKLDMLISNNNKDRFK